MNEELHHDAAFELLPWLVNGTLQGTERTQVEQHVRNCVACRIAIQEQRRLGELLKQQPTVPLSAERAFDGMLDRIARHARLRARPELPSFAPVLAGPFGRHAVTAAVLVTSLAVASWLVTLGREVSLESEFVTLTGQTTADDELDIVFAEGLSAGERNALVREIHGELVDGPNEVGRYRVRISADTDDIEETLAHLQGDSRVRFAARAFVEEPAR